MAAQLCTNCHAPLEIATAAAGAVVRCAYCKTENRALGAGLAHGAASPQAFGPPPGAFGAPPPGAFGAPPPGAFGAPPPGAFGAPPPGAVPGVIGGAPGAFGGAPALPGSYDANPKGNVAPPPAVVMPSSAGTNAELLGGIAGLLAWKGLIAIVGLIVPAMCCVSWIALQIFVGAAGR